MHIGYTKLFTDFRYLKNKKKITLPEGICVYTLGNRRK